MPGRMRCMRSPGWCQLRSCSECFVFCFVFLQGNKKGPLGRWDFDTQEEYSEYMNNKEALPK